MKLRQGAVANLLSHISTTAQQTTDDQERQIKTRCFHAMQVATLDSSVQISGDFSFTRSDCNGKD